MGNTEYQPPSQVWTIALEDAKNNNTKINICTFLLSVL